LHTKAAGQLNSSKYCMYWRECLKVEKCTLPSFGYRFPEDSCLKFFNISGDLY